MFLTEWDQEKVLAAEREESEQRGEKRMQNRVARHMLRENLPIPLIVKVSQLSEEVVRTLAKKLGLTV